MIIMHAHIFGRASCRALQCNEFRHLHQTISTTGLPAHALPFFAEAGSAPYIPPPPNLAVMSCPCFLHIESKFRPPPLLTSMLLNALLRSCEPMMP